MAELAGLPLVRNGSTSIQTDNQNNGRSSLSHQNGPPTPQSANMDGDRRSQLRNAYHARQAAMREELEGYYILIEDNHGLARQNNAIIRENQTIRAQLSAARHANSLQAQETEARIDSEKSLRQHAESQVTALTEERDALRTDKEESDISLTLLQGQVNALEAGQTALKADADNKLAEFEAGKAAVAQSLTNERERCKSVEEKNIKLEEDLRLQDERIEGLERDKDDVAKKLEAAGPEAKTTKASHKKEIEQLTTKIGLLERDLEKTSGANADFEQALETAQSRVEKLEKRCNQLNEEALQVNSLESKISDLEDKLDKKKKLQSDLSSLQSRHSKLQTELDQACQQNNSLSGKLNNAQSESVKNANMYNTTQKTLEERNTTIKELTQQRHRTALERDAANESKNDLDKKLSEECRAKKQLESTVAKLRTELQQSQTKLQQTEDDLEMIYHLSTRSGTRTAKDEALSVEDENAKGKAADCLPVTPCKAPLQQETVSASVHNGPSEDSAPPTTDDPQQDGSDTGRHTISKLSGPSPTSIGPDTSPIPGPTTENETDGEKIKISLSGLKAPGNRSPNKPSPLAKKSSTPAPPAPTPPAAESPAPPGLNTPAESGGNGKRKGGQHRHGDHRPPKKPRYEDAGRRDGRFDARDPPRDPRRSSLRDNMWREQNPYGTRRY